MAELTHFSYQPGNSFLHRLDVRFKLLFVVLIGLTGLRIHFTPLALLTVMAIVLIYQVQVQPMAVMKELRYLGYLLFVVFAARAVTTPGVSVFEIRIFSITQEGLYNGALIVWRILLIVLLGLIFVSSTRTSQTRGAVEWIFKPIPFVPEKRIATMIGLMIRFIPVILNQAKETALAQKARGIENRKNPVFRLKKLTFPLFRNILLNGENLADAMEARCYSENRTSPTFYAGKKEWISLFFVLCLCILSNLI
jgi:energy-coupling factor transporter transmembrane protein EcfT